MSARGKLRPMPDSEAVMAHHEKYGSCAIESGLVGNLADNECLHGSLPSDAKRSCNCWGPPPKKRRAR